MATRFRRLALMSLGAAFCLLFSFAEVSARDAASPIVVLPIVTAHPEDVYGENAEPSELTEVTESVRHDLAENLPDADIKAKPGVACADVTCARAIGRKIGAKTVVFGTVENEISVRWIVRFYALDVTTGRVIDSLNHSVIGNFEAMQKAIPELSACLGKSISGKPRCKLVEPPNQSTMPIISR